jgi:hypothetical protein|tara:strand:+ start:2882 stop:3580 length:699 start_codon:yes stop_codon:yes gene_type:complete
MGAGDLDSISLIGQQLPFDDFLLGSFGWFEGMGLPSDTRTDIVESAAALLIEQFKNKPRINTLVKTFAAQIQEIEYVLADLRQMKNLDQATGAQLDILGEYVGEERNGQNDDDYRESIKLRSFLNKSNGEPETVIAYAQSLTNATDITYLPLYPGKALLQIVTNFIVTSETIEKIQKIAPAGVKILTEIVQEGDVFGFDGEGGFPPAANIKGFGETGTGNESIGGPFIERIS